MGGRRSTPWLLAAFLGWLVGYPILIILVEATGLPAAFNLEHFAEFARRADEWRALWQSLWISALSVILAAAVGVPLAFVFQRAEFPGHRLLGSLIALPVALPPLVGVIAFLFLYGESGLLTRGVQRLMALPRPPWRLGGPVAILLVHAYSMYVYFYLFTRAALARLDASVLEAAASLGAGRWRTLARVTLPMLTPAMASAALLTFMTSLASFSAPYIFGGGFRVMTTQILASKLNGQVAMAQVETVTLATLALFGLWTLRRVDPGSTAVVGGVRGIAPTRHRLRGRVARLALTATAWALALVLLLPHLTLVLISLVPASTWTVELFPPVLNAENYAALLSTPERLRPLLNSLWMAAAATAAAVALGLAAARLATRSAGTVRRLLETLVAVPWALPGTVFAMALATAFAVQAPWAGRVVLVGTPWILPLAYLVRSLPLTGRSALAGLRQVDGSLEEAAAALGAGRWRRLRRVVLPLLRPAIMAGASLAFITAMGDFVTSIVLYTFDTRPISIEILSSLRLQETGVAAAYGVVLMVVSGTAFVIWGRDQGA